MASISIHALIPAAGASSRMGGSGSKALLRLGEWSIVERSVAALRQVPEIDRIVLLIRKQDREAFLQLPFDWQRTELVLGGETRQDSVRHGLEHLEAKLPPLEGSYILVHDAARCLVSPELVRRCLQVATLHQAVTCAVPVVDSIKQVGADGRVVKSLDRTTLVAVQTPQVFRYELLANAHRRGSSGATDDASLVEESHPVWVVPGERSNIKITTPEDFAWAAAYLEQDRS